MKLATKYALILPCCAIALLATIALAGANAAAASSWTLRQLPPISDQAPIGPGLRGVSCPSESLCVAVGGADTEGGGAGAVAFSQAPTGGLAKWHVGTLAAPAGEGEIRSLDAISCASQTLCVTVSGSGEGFIFVSTEPTGAAAAWSPTALDEGHGLDAVSCPSESFCAAVSEGGKVLTSTEPAAGHWQSTQLAGSPDLRGVSCATASLCVAVGEEGQILVSTDPTGGASAWQETGTPGGPGALQGISCVSTLLCATGNLTGNVLTSTDPSGGSSSWKDVITPSSLRITGVACPTASRCVADDDNGDVLTSTDPSGGADSWHFENLVPFVRSAGENGTLPPLNGLFAASCASTSLCALTGSDGRIFTSTEPFQAPTEAPAEAVEHHRHRARLRPRTILLPVEWLISQAIHRRIRVHSRFRSPTRVRGFECKLDRGSYRRCHSPLRYWVSHGRHALRVRAIGPTGLRGPAALIRFRIGHFRVIPAPRQSGPTGHKLRHTVRWPLHHRFAVLDNTFPSKTSLGAEGNSFIPAGGLR
ncbi:MAG: hypothetical protein WB507_10055 [Solirubrobacterales bacterium]